MCFNSSTVTKFFTCSGFCSLMILQIENEFTMAEVGVTCSCQCMQEGVSVDIADGIVLLDPKQSLVDIVQIIGRVSRLHHNKSVSSIIHPIVYKFINGVPIIKKNNYKKVVEILTNLCASSNDILNIVKNISSIFN